MRESKNKISWLEMRACSRYRRKGTVSKMDLAEVPDLTILHCRDAIEWKVYLMDCFSQLALPNHISIHEERLEEITFPLPSGHSQAFTSAKAVLIVISPDFLDYVDSHGNVYELGKLLQPTRTIAMLCGVQEEDILPIHRAALVSYDAWPRLVARDQDKEFVLSVLQTTQEVLSRESASPPQFKLANRKVKQGNGTVYVMLNKPMSDKQRPKVILESDGLHDVLVKRRNPYTLQFVVPDSIMTSSKFINVHLKCDDCYLGCRPLKYESKMGELNSLLTSLNSPYEMLCQTLGVSSLCEVDSYLVKSYSHNLSDLSMKLTDPGLVKTKSEEELPTLLHFSARYGLRELTSLVIQNPVAKLAVLQKNSQGLVPAQLASLAGHNEIATMLQDIQDRLSLFNSSRDDVSSKSTNYRLEPPECVYEHMKDIHPSLYDIPPCPGTRRSSENEVRYLPMVSHRRKSSFKDLEPHQRLLFGVDEHGDEKSEEDLSALFPLSQDTDIIQLRSDKEDEVDSQEDAARGSQQELIQILENYKRGASMTEVERLFHEWQAKHQYSSEARKEGLEDLRERYREVNKEKKGGAKLPQFAFSDLRSFISSKLGRKDSLSGKVSLSVDNEKLAPFGGEVYRPISTLSTASTASNSSSASSDRCSAVSAASVYDSGNHSDSCDEIGRLKGMHEQKGATQKSVASNSDPAKLTHCPPWFSHSATMVKPPIPPPRPPKLPLNRPPQPADEAEPDHIYYTFAASDLGQEEKQVQDVVSPDYVSPDPDPLFPKRDMDALIKRALGEDQTVPATVSNMDQCDRLVSSYADVPSDDLYQIPPTPIPTSMPPNSSRLKVHVGKDTPNRDYSNVTVQRASLCGDTSDSYDYYDIPALPVPLNAGFSQMARRHSMNPSVRPVKMDQDRTGLREPTYIEIVNTPNEALDNQFQYYDIPRYACRDSRCDSVPDELPPPPPVEGATAPQVIVDGPPQIVSPSEAAKRKASTLPPVPLGAKSSVKVCP